MDQQHMVPVPKMNKIPFLSEISQQMHKMYEHVAIIIQIWYKAKCCFTCMSNTLYLISVSNMNKITTFISELSQVLKIDEKITIITQIWHRAKLYFICMSSPSYPEMLLRFSQKA